MRPLVGKTILVVEDELLIAMQIVEELTEHGATVMGPFADVEGALCALTSTTPSAAILDWWLFDRSAAAIAAVLASRHVPVVVHTGLIEAPNDLAPFSKFRIVAKPAGQGALIEHLTLLTREGQRTLEAT